MRYFLTILVAIICVTAFAQKPSINKAKTALDKGDLSLAKTIIDQAINYEKTKNKAKTWYYRGNIYLSLDTVANEPGAMKTAMESYNRALELDPDQKTLTEFVGGGIENVDSKKQSYYGYYYSKAVAAYQAQNFTGAADGFENAYYIIPQDTVSMQNAAYASSEAGDDERAKMNFQKALEMGMTNLTIYLRLYNYEIQDENLESAYVILEQARKVYPDNIDIQKFQINILIQQDKVDEAKAGIEEAISQEPENADLHFSLGVIKEELKDVEGARASYSKAIEIDVEHYNSNFNLGVIVFNECNALLKERNALGYREVKKYDELTVQIDERLKTALPYWEKLYSLKSEEESVLETLKFIYVNLKMNDKAEKMADELDLVRGDD